MTLLEAPTNLSAAANAPKAVYIHIPFCLHKCGYCDFASLAGVDHLADRYLRALEKEMADQTAPAGVATIFVGGGTPTRLEPRQLERLVNMIERRFPLESGGEWTVEANPGTLTREKAEILARGGVNRLSIGAQSFQPRSLEVLERHHAPHEAKDAARLAGDHFPRWSLDLIFGVPGSSLDDWRADLDAAIELEPRHLSCYGLVYETGTALWKQWKSGVVQPMEEETERAMLELTIERLGAEGLAMYEISNYAVPGEECRHNLVYWANEPYYAAGVGAARYTNGVRALNTRSIDVYLRKIEAGESAQATSERLEPEARARETAVLMLRRVAIGIDRDDFRERTGFGLDDLFGDAIARHVRTGLLIDEPRRIRLSDQGLFLADTVLSDFV